MQGNESCGLACALESGDRALSQTKRDISSDHKLEVVAVPTLGVQHQLDPDLSCYCRRR